MHSSGLELTPNLILADHRLPQFDSVGALAGLRERGLDVPFVIVSGAIGQVLAVGLMEQGAADFVLKDRLARLGPAVLRALERKLLRDEKRLAEQRFLASERASVPSSSTAPTGSSSSNRRPRSFTPAPPRPASWAMSRGSSPVATFSTSCIPKTSHPSGRSSKPEAEPRQRRLGHVPHPHKDGSWRWVEMTGTNLLAEPDVQAIVINLHDVTDASGPCASLQEQTQLLQSILESMGEGVIVADRNERFRIFNAAAQQMYGQGAARHTPPSGPRSTTCTCRTG